MHLYSYMLRVIIYYVFLGCIPVLELSAAGRDLGPLTANRNLWDSTQDQFAKKFPGIEWVSGERDGEFEYKRRGMVFWGEPVHQLNVVEDGGAIKVLKMTVLEQGTALFMSKRQFDKDAKRWSGIISAKLGIEGRKLPSIMVGKVLHRRLAWSCENSFIVLSINSGKRPDRIELICYEKSYGVARARLRGKLSQRGGGRGNGKGVVVKRGRRLGEDGGGLREEGLAASEVKSRIRTAIRSILSRKAPGGISRDVQDAVNMLNVYRFLSGVPSDVEADAALVAKSQEAAEVCNGKGQLSHDFGHFTDKCNLAMNGSGISMEESVIQYVEDHGENNRERRGHRRWCLHHKMGKTGFGLKGAYSAMYSLDQSASGISRNYSYPGHGFYPKKYLHGNGWSYHLVGGRAPDDSVVRVWKLRKYVDKADGWDEDPDGREYEVGFTFVYDDTIVFEPGDRPITKRGSYLVRIQGSGLKEQYLVHLY